MKRVIQLCIAAALAVGLVAPLMTGSALAEAEVLESDIAELPVGTRIADDRAVKLPDGKTVRVLEVSSGNTRTLKGPYEGTVGDYKDKRSWWQRMTGGGSESQAPIGATRGFKRPEN